MTRLLESRHGALIVFTIYVLALALCESLDGVKP